MSFFAVISNSFSFRKFCTSGFVCNGKSKFYANREGRMMNKIMNGNKLKFKSKKYFPDVDVPNFSGSSGFFDLIGNQSGSAKTQRRLVVLNKMLMRNISDILSTGELSSELTGKGLHLSRVALAPTLNQINVYWLANGDEEQDNEISEQLAKIAPTLRHSMCQLSLMGSIPKIEFIKDCKYIKFLAVENLLKKADFGDDFTPTPLANDWKTEHVLEKTLPDDIKTKIQEAESNASVFEKPLPPMQTNVLGLNQESIMNRVKVAVEKMKAKHRRNSNFPSSLSVNDTSGDSNILKELSRQQRKRLFADYLNQRQIAWRKEQKKEKKIVIEKVMHEKEVERRLVKEFMKDVDNSLEEDYYFDHEYDEQNQDEIENKFN